MHTSGSLLREGLLPPCLQGTFESAGTRTRPSPVPHAHDNSAQDGRQGEAGDDEHAQLSAIADMGSHSPAALPAGRATLPLVGSSWESDGRALVAGSRG
jgi:hypothetical protein